MSRLSVVLPAYNEELMVGKTCHVLHEVLAEAGISYELVVVDDGSKDKTWEEITKAGEKDGNVLGVHFSRNFGKEAAVYAGMAQATGDVVAVMDCDLQHPPECLPEIVRKFEEGCGVISMVRTKNKSAGLIKNITSAGFYWVINTLSDVKFEPNASDFFAVSKEAADVLRKNYREKVRFLRGYVQSIGFQKATITYEAHDRVAGESKYSLRTLLAFSMNTIMCFSNLPLKLGIYAGAFAGLLGVAVMVYTLFTRQGAPSGYATIVILNCFMFAILFLIVGIIGEYIAILFSELKDRPIYIVEETQNIASQNNVACDEENK